MKRRQVKALGILFILFHISRLLQAQQQVQTIRGSITDAESHAALPFASVAIFRDSTLVQGAEADEEGRFRIPNVPVGRYTLKARIVGYNPVVLSNIILTSGKEIVLPIAMDEAVVEKKEVVINGRASQKAGTVNEMALVSARTFTVEETNRYAGSRSDPARMASNFAGVQGTDDSRNDIVVRGNSPLGVLYRYEDVNIPNPNHFAIAGSAGGPVSILNNKVIATSDFLTGAFPAEYGNSIAGVFDLHMRNGNNEKYEFTGQFGVLGTEIAAEGPLSKKSGSSFLMTYRYSTLQILQGLHLPIGTSAIPNYQDASFKLNFPLSEKSNLSFFGIGGMSHIDLVVSKYETPPSELYGDNDRDQYFGSSMGVVGTSYSHVLSKNTYVRVTLSASVNNSFAHHALVFRDTAGHVIYPLTPNLGYRFTEARQGLSAYINHKIGSRQTLKAGIYVDRYGLNLLDSNLNLATKLFENRWDYQGAHFLLQPYVQYRYKFSEKLVLSTGLHAQYFTLNGSKSLEPRAALRWDFAKRQSLGLAYGLHSQLQPMYIYFYHLPNASASTWHNKDVGFTRSQHFVLSYNNMLSEFLRLKAEAYYQYLFDVPIDRDVQSSFSLLNQGSSFDRFYPGRLVNAGTGRNYGVELTLEKFFSKNYFFMFTGSLFNSTYKGSDGVERNTDFNGNFASNLLAGREFAIGKNNTFTIGGKLTYAGGKRYSPVDIAESRKQNVVVIVDSARNSLQFKDYFRADLKFAYKVNRKKLTHEMGIDLVNVFNTKNVLSLTYVQNVKNPDDSYVREEYQLGFLPLFYYKLDFTTK